MYGTESVPSYEVNETTLTILQSIMTHVEQRKNHSKVIAENLRRKADEYSAEGQRIHEILNQSGITLPVNVQPNVSSIAAAACVLSLKNASTTSFILSVQGMVQDKIKATASRKEEFRVSEKLAAETIVMQQRMQQLTKELKDAEKCSAEQLSKVNSNSKFSSFLRSKIEQYEKDLNCLEEKLRELGADPKIYHSELTRDYNTVKDFKTKLESVQMKVKSYICLPANEDLARVKIAEAEIELEKLEKELLLKLENVISSANPMS